MTKGNETIGLQSKIKDWDAPPKRISIHCVPLQLDRDLLEVRRWRKTT